MNPSRPVVSLHPYFKVHPGKLDAVKAVLQRCVEQTRSEPKCLSYEFTRNDDVVFCRESYEGADGALTHIGNVTPLLGELLKMAELIRLEIHGPAVELEKMRAPLAALKPAWFATELGLQKA